MHSADVFLKALSVVLCVAAITTVLFQRLRLPVVLGYILAGLIIGPNVPIPLVADAEVVETLSELGVILLMFSLGLDFRLKTLFDVGPTAVVTAIIETSAMLWLGYSVGRLFGWTPLESLFCGSAVAISSTTIIAKAFEEQGVTGHFKDLVLGILIVEDLIAIVLMTTLTAVSSGQGLSAMQVVITSGKLALFLVALLVGGLLLVPRFIRWVVAHGRAETTLVASIGICFAISALAREFDYSAALGAFIAGSLVAEADHGHRVEQLVTPVRDIFAAVFFVSVGMHIDPGLVLAAWQPTLVLSLVVLVGKTVGVSLGAFLTSGAPKVSVRSGMALSQIGEFSFIIAGLGLSLGVTGSFLYPVLVIVSAVTTLTTPFMIRHSEPAAVRFQRSLPPPLQTFTSLYASWLEQLRRSRSRKRSRLQRLVGLLVLDGLLLFGIVALTSIFFDKAVDALKHGAGLDTSAARWTIVATASVMCAPLAAGLVSVSRRLGRSMAARILPDGEVGRVDLMATPRRALVVTFELVTVVLVGAPMVALTQPFLPGVVSVGLVGALFASVAVLGLLFWRTAADLQGHVRAGTEVLVSALAMQAKAGPRELEAAAPTLAQIDLGLGRPVSVKLDSDSPAVGHTLAMLDLRVVTGASALALIRDGVGSVPDSATALLPGDILALSGTREAIAAARSLLTGRAIEVIVDTSTAGDDDDDD